MRGSSPKTKEATLKRLSCVKAWLLNSACVHKFSELENFFFFFPFSTVKYFLSSVCIFKTMSYA